MPIPEKAASALDHMSSRARQNRWSVELARDAESKRDAVVLLRWVLVIATAAVIVLRPHDPSERSIVHWTALFLIASNILLGSLPLRFFVMRGFDTALVLCDIALVSFAICLTGAVRGEYYLLYFLVLIIAAVGETFATICVAAFVISAAYIGLLWTVGGGIDSETLLRIPFVFIVAIFYGYFAQLVRAERGRSLQYQSKLVAAKRLREWSTAFSGTPERERILESLALGARELCGVDYAAILRRTDGRIVYEDGDQARRPSDERVAALFEKVSRRIGFRERGREIGTDETSHRAHVLPGHPRPSPISFIEGGTTLLPILGGEASSLYLMLSGELESDQVEYVALLIASADLALASSARFQELVHEAENRRVIVRQLSEALDFSSQFVANISHEIRTPLLSLIGFAELLRNGGYGPLTDEQRGVAARMVRNGESLLELLNGILDLAKLDAGAVRCRPVPGSLDDLVQDVVQTCMPLLGNKPVTLSGRCREPAVAKTDWGLIRQIALNLVSNAVKFTLRGSIAVEAWLDGDREELRIEVRDTGVGMEPGRLAEIFEPFRQLEDSYTKRFAGTGLGLAISKRYAELLGGTIAVESAPGEGSLFRITIPVGSPTLGTGTPLRASTSSQL